MALKKGFLEFAAEVYGAYACILAVAVDEFYDGEYIGL
jgi:hypothetical protein